MTTTHPAAIAAPACTHAPEYYLYTAKTQDLGYLGGVPACAACTDAALDATEASDTEHPAAFVAAVSIAYRQAMTAPIAVAGAY